MYLKQHAILSVFLLPVFGLLLVSSCKRQAHGKETSAGIFSIRGFNPATNRDLTETLELDYAYALGNGFVIPSLSQVKEGQFTMEFYIRNLGKSPMKFAYKIFWQNESYKFRETDPNDSTKFNPSASENFYGSWEDSLSKFRFTSDIPADGEYHKVSDLFRITGNPRNEKRYFRDGRNERWKRNPRVGEYSFMLVVTTEANISKHVIPDYIQDISRMGPEGFIPPYYYFLYGGGKLVPGTVVETYGRKLKVIARPDPGAGIYIHPDHFNKATADKYATPCCGQDSNFYKHAAFEQFIHYIDPGTKLYNIPVVDDVLGDNYSRTDYNWNQYFIRRDELIGTVMQTAHKPCQTVISDPKSGKITMFNPGCEFGKWEKQNVGVITRHPLTYGKWTVKAKLTRLLNKNNMWNGLTNAIWLITKDQGDWNLRRDCKNGGYMANYYGGGEDKRIKNVGYSEIDFEILKTVPYCPSWVLPPVYNRGVADQYNVPSWNVPFPEEILAGDGDITVSCTNWDMACWDPANFREGCQHVNYRGQEFWAHRWDRNYRALTEKESESNEELFGSAYYYFQIDWRPDEIIWRIGPSKDKLRVVGYVNDKITCIPDNEMLLIITQEFHNTKWWIGSAYQQDNIPFPSKKITGEVYEVTIE